MGIQFFTISTIFSENVVFRKNEAKSLGLFDKNQRCLGLPMGLLGKARGEKNDKKTACPLR